jgi:prophage regulatory protein
MSIHVSLKAPEPRTKRIFRLPKVIEVSGLSRTSIYRLMGIGRFPKCIKIGIKAVGWLESEIEHWIGERELEAMGIDGIEDIDVMEGIEGI